jgi:hypothetical protein
MSDLSCSDDFVEWLCVEVASGGTLKKISEDNPNRCPCVSTLRKWLFDSKKEHEHLRLMYSLATRARVEALIDEITELEAECTAKIAEQEFDSRKVNAIAAHYRQMIEDRKWLAAKLAPRDYGDRLALANDDRDGLIVNFKIPRPAIDTPVAQGQLDGKNLTLALPIISKVKEEAKCTE